MTDKKLKQIIFTLSIFLILLIILAGIGATSSGKKIILSDKQFNLSSTNKAITDSLNTQYRFLNSDSTKKINKIVDVLPNKYTIVAEQDNENYMWIERADGSVIKVKREYNQFGKTKVTFQGRIKALDIKIPRSESELQFMICFDTEVARLKKEPFYAKVLSKCGKKSAFTECLKANNDILKRVQAKCPLPQ